MQIGSVSCVNFKGSAPLCSIENPIDVPYKVEYSPEDEFISSYNPIDAEGSNDKVTDEVSCQESIGKLSDEEKAKRTVELLKKIEEKADKKDGNGKPKRKTVIQTAASILGALAVTYFLSKKLYKGASETVGSVFKTAKVKSVTEGISDKISKAISGNKRLSEISQSKVFKNAQEFLKKGSNREKLAGVIGSVGGTTYLLRTDSNKDGIPDLAEKGVNAYKAALEKGGMISEAIKIIS